MRQIGRRRQKWSSKAGPPGLLLPPHASLPKKRDEPWYEHEPLASLPPPRMRSLAPKEPLPSASSSKTYFVRLRQRPSVAAAVLPGLLPSGIPHAEVLRRARRPWRFGPPGNPVPRRCWRWGATTTMETPCQEPNRRCPIRRLPERRKRHFEARTIGQRNSWCVIM